MTDSDRAELKATRQYDKQPLQPLAFDPLRRFDDNSHLARVEAPEGMADYLWESLPLAGEGWTLHLLRPRNHRAKVGPGLHGVADERSGAGRHGG